MCVLIAISRSRLRSRPAFSRSTSILGGLMTTSKSLFEVEVHSGWSGDNVKAAVKVKAAVEVEVHSRWSGEVKAGGYLRELFYCLFT
jgi:hypothetical protein